VAASDAIDHILDGLYLLSALIGPGFTRRAALVPAVTCITIIIIIIVIIMVIIIIMITIIIIIIIIIMMTIIDAHASPIPVVSAVFFNDRYTLTCTPRSRLNDQQ